MDICVLLILLVTLGHQTLSVGANNVVLLKQRTINGQNIFCITVQCEKACWPEIHIFHFKNTKTIYLTVGQASYWDQYFESCTLNNTYDSCHGCKDGKVNPSPINSVVWDYCLGDGICIDDPCVCDSPESIRIKSDNCKETGRPVCICDRGRNFYGDDFFKCYYFDDICPAGKELKNTGHCGDCEDGYFKGFAGKGLCKEKTKCTGPNLEILDPGSKIKDASCRSVTKPDAEIIYIPHSADTVYPLTTPTWLRTTKSNTKKKLTEQIPTTIKPVNNTSNESDGSSTKTLEIILPVLGVIFVLLAVVLILFLFRRYRSQCSFIRNFSVRRYLPCLKRVNYEKNDIIAVPISNGNAAVPVFKGNAAVPISDDDDDENGDVEVPIFDDEENGDVVVPISDVEETSLKHLDGQGNDEVPLLTDTESSMTDPKQQHDAQEAIQETGVKQMIMNNVNIQTSFESNAASSIPAAYETYNEDTVHHGDMRLIKQADDINATSMLLPSSATLNIGPAPGLNISSMFRDQSMNQLESVQSNQSVIRGSRSSQPGNQSSNQEQAGIQPENPDTFNYSPDVEDGE